MKEKLYILFFILSNTLTANSLQQNTEDVRKLTLEEVVHILCLQSPSARIEQFNFRNDLLQFENYKKGFLPSISFSLNPFSFNRSIKLVQYPEDGSYSYVEDFSNSSSTGLSVNQKIGFTGGELTIGSNLSFFSDFTQKRNTFNTSPLFIGYNQQLLGGYKKYKFEKDIENAKNEVSVKQFCSNISDIQHQSLNLFMDALLARLEQELSLKNQQISDTLLCVANVKFKNGGITEYEYKQIELQSVNNKYAHENSKKKYHDTTQKLLTFLDLDAKTEVLIELPLFNLPIELNASLILFYIGKNNPVALQMKIKRLEAENTLFTTKLSNRFNGNISLNYGINQYAEQFIEAYKNPNIRQSAMISFQIPVFQWGINRNKIKIAENSYQATVLSIEKEQSEFDNQIDEEINNYNHNVNLWFIAEQAFRLSQDQYKMLAQKYSLGKVSVYELTSSQQEQSMAMQKYYSAIKDVWNSYFYLRKVTLYDFVNQQELTDMLVKK